MGLLFSCLYVPMGLNRLWAFDSGHAWELARAGVNAEPLWDCTLEMP